MESRKEILINVYLDKSVEAYNSTMKKATELFHRAKLFIETVKSKI